MSNESLMLTTPTRLRRLHPQSKHKKTKRANHSYMCVCSVGMTFIEKSENKYLKVVQNAWEPHCILSQTLEERETGHLKNSLEELCNSRHGGKKEKRWGLTGVVIHCSVYVPVIIEINLDNASKMLKNNCHHTWGTYVCLAFSPAAEGCEQELS